MFARTAFAVTLLAACTSVLAGSQEIWNPKITAPTAGTVWTAGKTYTVTWDTSDAPASISESSKVVLAKDGKEDVEHPLAQGFDLHAGHVSVTIPAATASGNDYTIVLFGDSGNLSPQFTIA